MKKGIRYWIGSFAGRIISMVMLGILLIAVTVSAVVLIMSKKVFTDTYGKSQEKVFLQIEKELNDFHDRLQEVVDAIDSSWAFRLYLNNKEQLNNVQTFQNIYQMEKDLEQSKSSDMERLNILVIGTGGQHYLARTETISMSDEDIWNSKAVKIALEEPEVLHYTFSHGAYTATAKNTDVIIVSKALYYHESKEVYGVVLITLTMDDLRTYYDYFVTDSTSFYLVGAEGKVMCSDDRKSVGRELKTDWYQQLAADRTDERTMAQLPGDGRSLMVMQRELAYLDCYIYGVIDNDMALGRLYNMPLLISLCAMIGCLILVLCLLAVQQTISPLSQLVQKMSTIREGEFTQYMPVQGTIEVQELAATYNYMLDDIQSYIDELIETQKEQRKSEIKALQMQINPHYIYNTLASIKWLVYQNDNDKTIQTIDAFISLLRNTISNTDEFITIEQELVNLQNYILINHTRYGDAVQVEYYVSQNCRNCLLPKLILQPFIENAFFHGFPSGQSGTIQIFMKEKDNELEIRIEDDGIGMDQSQAEQAVNQNRGKEYFSGIGIHNVQDRLKLLYGKEYGVTIFSRKNEGTIVTIKLPANRKEQEGANATETTEHTCSSQQ